MPENSRPPQKPIDPGRLLEQANFSRAARGRERLRAQLLESASSGGLRQAPLQLRLLESAGLVLLLGVFVFAISGLLNGRQAGPGAAIASATPPAPATVTPARPGLEPAPTLAPQTPQPSPTSPPRLDANASADAIRIAISEPDWKTLWAELEIDRYSTSANNTLEQRAFAQAWLEKGGRGLVADTDPVAGDVSSPQGLDWRWLTLFDGKSLLRYEPLTGLLTTVQEDASATLYPLESASPVMELINPGNLMILSSNPRLQRMEFILDRWTLVVDWGAWRLWVDSQTGLLIKSAKYRGAVGSSALESVIFIRRLALNLALDAQIFNPNGLKTVQPEVPAVPTPTAIPSPTAWASASPAGWVYVQTGAQAPFEWKVFSMPAACLFGRSACTSEWQVSGNPNIQAFPVFSPDHRTALLSDTNTNNLVALDVQSRQWSSVVKGFYQLQLVWSGDSRQVAALGQGDGAYDDGLVVIQREGWKVRPVPTALKGNKEILGWLDDSSLAILIRPVSSFKGETPAWVDQFKAGLYRVDTNTGQATTLIEGGEVGAKGPSLSPDGKQLAFAELEGSRTVIGLANLDGSGWRSLGVEGGLPRWSPDGKWIALEGNQTATNGQLTAWLSLVKPDGSGARTVLNANGMFEYLWSPDSKYLLVVTREDPAPRAFLYSVENGQLQELNLPILNGQTAWNLLSWEP